MDYVKGEFLYTEKYRPRTLEDCVLPVDLKRKLQALVSKGDIPNCLLVGDKGVGKSTAAVAMCNELGIDPMFINASLEGNIDVLRTKIQRFASSVSMFDNKRKIVILDEADYLNKQSTQPALRAFMEAFSTNCGFIMTCNFQNRLIEPLWSRNTVFDFKFPKSDSLEAKNLMGQFLKRCDGILENESVEYQNKVVAQLIKKHYPDFRRVLNELQTFAATGSVDSSILVQSEASIGTLVPYLKARDFKMMRQWCSDNNDVDSASIFRTLYDHLYEVLEKATIPQAVLILNEGQKADAIVVDKELNVVATLTELMANCIFKGDSNENF